MAEFCFYQVVFVSSNNLAVMKVVYFFNTFVNYCSALLQWLPHFQHLFRENLHYSIKCKLAVSFSIDAVIRLSSCKDYFSCYPLLRLLRNIGKVQQQIFFTRRRTLKIAVPFRVNTAYVMIFRTSTGFCHC